MKNDTPADPIYDNDYREQYIAAGGTASASTEFTWAGNFDGRYSLEFVYDGQGQPRIVSSSSAPLSAALGDLWWDTQNLALKVYHNDGNSNQWVAA